MRIYLRGQPGLQERSISQGIEADTNMGSHVEKPGRNEVVIKAGRGFRVRAQNTGAIYRK